MRHPSWVTYFFSFRDLPIRAFRVGFQFGASELGLREAGRCEGEGLCIAGQERGRSLGGGRG